MKRSIVLALAGALACSAILSTVPARSASLYPVWIEMKGEGATITVFSPTFQSIRVTAYVPANTTKSYAMETAPVYEFQTTVCGKRHVARWTRAGTGVRAIVSCTGISFVPR